MQENGKNFSTVLNSEVFSAEAFAIDQLTSVMYYFEKKAGQIMMATLNGLHKKIIINNLKQVVDLVIHEEFGYLFFSDYSEKIIGRVDTDGTNLIINNEKLWNVTGLALDKTEGRLYFCDDKEKIILSTDLHFKDYRIHIHMTTYNIYKKKFELKSWNNFIAAPQSLAVHHDKLLWTDTTHNAIFQTEKRFGEPIEYVVGAIGKPRDMHVFNNDKIPGKYLKGLLDIELNAYFVAVSRCSAVARKNYDGRPFEVML